MLWTWVRHISRFIVAVSMLWTVSTLVPGFSFIGFWVSFFASIVIAVLGWIIESTIVKDISPFARGVVGFAVTASVIFIAASIIPNVKITFFGVMITALVVGIVDLFIPSKARSY